MADEAFALSPIHARAAMPTDADYDAIQEAFMETSRGRWFLTEYAKRNRNADTRMVLEAVERLETSLASQKEAQAEAVAAAAEAAAIQAAEAVAMRAAEAAAAQAAAAQPTIAEARPHVDLWPELANAFARARMEIAQRLVRESNDEAFEAIRASAETLKSIAWALRERGFDARICDFIDIQVNKITDGYTGLMAETSVATETEADILNAFDDLIAHVEGLTGSSEPDMEALDIVVDAVADAMNEDDVAEAMPEDDDIAVAVVHEPAVAVSDIAPANEPVSTVAEAAPIDEPPAVIFETAPPEVSAPQVSALEAPPSTGSYPDAAFHEIYGDDSDIEIVDTAAIDEPPAPPVPPPPTELEMNRQRLYEAKLGLYRVSAATAKAAVQIVSPVDDIEIVEVATADAAPARSAIDRSPQPVAEVVAAPTVVADQTPLPAPGKPSLGQALLDNGVIQNTDRPDALAPFRRMSQAEKVAFFT
jgi:hypothetical protein